MLAATWIKHNNPPKGSGPSRPSCRMAICILLALVFSPGFFTSPFSGARKRIYSHRIWWGCRRMTREGQGTRDLVLERTRGWWAGGRWDSCRHCRFSQYAGGGPEKGRDGARVVALEPRAWVLSSHLLLRSVYFVRVTDRGLFSAPEIVTDPSSWAAVRIRCIQPLEWSLARGKGPQVWALLF